jgi:hypothetical protein
MQSPIQHRIKQARAALQEKRDALEQERASIKKEVRKAKAIKNSAQRKEKIQFLDLKLPALENAYKAVMSAQDDLFALLNEDLRDYYQKMRGLLAYATATGGGLSPDATLLFDTLGDFLAAKSEGDRASASKAVNLILAHGNVFAKGEAGTADDEIARQFEAMEDGESRTAFYNKHSAEIQRAFDARKNNP